MDIYYKKASLIILGSLFSVFLTGTVFGQNMFRKVNDFDGDGKADFAVTRNVDGYKYWYVWQSRDGFRAFHWGINNDQNTAGDYDGDGKTDFAIFRKEVVSANTMNISHWVFGSQAGIMRLQFSPGNRNFLANPQDYDGDGKTDFAISYPWNQAQTEFRIEVMSSNGGTGFNTIHFAPFIKIGDMTGDGKAEVASYNSNTNIVSIENSATHTIQTIPFGLADDEFVAADFDGDAKGDLTVFRQTDGTWWWLRSSDNVIAATTFGAPGDVPVPADYDGDGKTDHAIWRSGAQSYFWVYGSQSGVFALPWGVSDDTVVRY